MAELEVVGKGEEVDAEPPAVEAGDKAVHAGAYSSESPAVERGALTAGLGVLLAGVHAGAIISALALGLAALRPPGELRQVQAQRHGMPFGKIA